jgi:cation diffusion facilitator family transporter
MTSVSNETGEKEKRAVALSSVIAAIFLTSMKITVGILTNSLGILSEAAHSGLDLIAAGVTYFAVRVSDRPPDREHTYGHGKIENFSALVETLLLLATCGWIIYEAIHRLIEPVRVEATIWSFAVMGTSILIDVTRSRALMRTAKKYHSQALEADALHFSTDVWSSTVVILGLAAVWLAQWLSARANLDVGWLFRADAIAALGVSGIVIYVSIQLGRRTINGLLDTASKEVVEQIENVVRAVPDVSQIRRIRMRQSGPSTFVDMTIAVPRSLSLEEAHQTAIAVEESIQERFPRTDVMVQIAPVVKDEHSLVEQVHSAAARRGVDVHSIRAHNVRGKLSLEMHVEVRDDLTLGEAHEKVSEFERLLYDEIPKVREVVTHIEPVGDREIRQGTIQANLAGIEQALHELSIEIPAVRDCHQVKVHRAKDEFVVTLHCRVVPEMPLRNAHQLTVEIEDFLRNRFPEVGRVLVHLEPLEMDHKGEDAMPQANG